MTQIHHEKREKNGTRRADKIHFLMLIGLQFVTTCVEGVIGPVLPDLICIMRTDLKSASTIFFSYWAGQSCVCLLAMCLHDKLDLTLAMIVSLVFLAFLLAPIPLVTLLPVADLLFVLAGGCCGMLKIGTYVQMGLLSPKNNYGFHIMSAGSTLGFVGTPIIASVFVHHHTPEMEEDREMKTVKDICVGFTTNIEYVFLLLSLICLGFAIVCAINYPNVLNSIDIWKPDLPKVSEVRNKGFQFFVFKFLLLCLIGTLGLVPTSLLSLLVTYGARSQLSLTVSRATLLTSIFSMCLLVSRVFNVTIANKVKPDKMFSIYLGITLLTSAFFFIYKASNTVVLYIVCVSFGIGTGPYIACMLSWSKSYVPLTIRFVSMYVVFMCVENLFHPTITGVLMDVYGPDMFVYMTSGVSLVQLLLFALVWRAAGLLKDPSLLT